MQNTTKKTRKYWTGTTLWTVKCSVSGLGWRSQLTVRRYWKQLTVCLLAPENSSLSLVLPAAGGACAGNTGHSSLSLQLQFRLAHVTIELNVQSADRMRALRSHSVVGIRSRLPDPREHDFSVVDVASMTTSLGRPPWTTASHWNGLMT